MDKPGSSCFLSLDQAIQTVGIINNKKNIAKRPAHLKVFHRSRDEVWNICLCGLMISLGWVKIKSVFPNRCYSAVNERKPIVNAEAALIVRYLKLSEHSICDNKKRPTNWSFRVYDIFFFHLFTIFLLFFFFFPKNGAFPFSHG